jgi:hypothetical protein
MNARLQYPLLEMHSSGAAVTNDSISNVLDAIKSVSYCDCRQGTT